MVKQFSSSFSIPISHFSMKPFSGVRNESATTPSQRHGRCQLCDAVERLRGRIPDRFAVGPTPTAGRRVAEHASSPDAAAGGGGAPARAVTVAYQRSSHHRDYPRLREAETGTTGGEWRRWPVSKVRLTCTDGRRHCEAFNLKGIRTPPHWFVWIWSHRDERLEIAHYFHLAWDPPTIWLQAPTFLPDASEPNIFTNSLCRSHARASRLSVLLCFGHSDDLRRSITNARNVIECKN